MIQLGFFGVSLTAHGERLGLGGMGSHRRAVRRSLPRAGSWSWRGSCTGRGEKQLGSGSLWILDQLHVGWNRQEVWGGMLLLVAFVPGRLGDAGVTRGSAVGSLDGPLAHPLGG